MARRRRSWPSVSIRPTENPETETIHNATPGTYVIDVYDCANGCSDQPQGVEGDYNLTVTVN